MAYDKYTWQTGETITAEKLNHMEDGIADMGSGSVLVVNANLDSSTGNLVLDKTWAEIQEAVVSHGAIVHMNLLGRGDFYSLASVSMISMESSNKYAVFMLDGGDTSFVTDSVNGYPTNESEPSS